MSRTVSEGGVFEPEPIGVGRFGNIYDQFKRRAVDAVKFLFKKKGGEAKDVFYREEIGTVGLVWGDDKQGLQHIIQKHIITHSDFNSVGEMLSTIQDVIENGDITIQTSGNYRIEKDGKRAIIAKNENGDFVLTAYDSNRSIGEKKRSDADTTLFDQRVTDEMNGALVSSDIATESEVSENVGEKQNIEDNSQIGSETPSSLQGTPPKQGSEGELVIPTDEKGKKLYESAPVEATINDIYNDEELDEEEADAFVQAKIDGATKRIAQLEKKKPKMGEEKEAYIAERAKWREQVAEQQASLAYWQGVQESKANGKLRVENGEQSVPSIESGTTTTSETATTTNITPTSENKQDVHKEPQQEETQEEGAFGKIYRQFKGKAKEAFAFLTKMKSGDALGVFTREGIGDIDLVWGDKNGGLAHIISKHVGESKSFSSVEDAQSVISDIIENGEVMFENGDKVVISKNGKIVTLRKNYREKGKKIADKNWILTAYDETKADGTSAISGINQGQAAQPTDVSTDKDTTNFRDLTEKLWRITDFLNKSYVYNFENEVDFYNWVARKLKNKKAIRKWIADKFPPHLVNEVVKTIFAYGKALAKRKQSTIGVNAVADARGLATDAVIASLEGSGIEVVEATDAMAEAVLGMANPGVELSAKQKRALETALPEDESSFKGTAISNADGAKVLNNLDNLQKEYEEKSSNITKNFLGDVADALGIEAKDKSSKYARFETKNGKVVTIRLSNHNAKVSNFDNNGEFEGISIVISRKANEGITNDGNAHIVEFNYSDKKLTKAEGKPLAEIVRSIKQALYSGEFTDTTGLAERQEVNLNEIEAHIVYHGSGAKFDAFDHSHMGEGEGAQAYGWGTYVTEVEGIGRAYAEATAKGESLQSLEYKLYEIESQIEQYEGELEDDKRQVELAEDWVRDEQNILDKFLKRANELKEEYGESSAEYQNHVFYADAYTGELRNAKMALENCIDTVKGREATIAKLKADEAMAIQAIENYKPPKRQLYTVEIPEDNGSNYLSWDNPVSDNAKGMLYAQIRKEGAEKFDFATQKFWVGKSVVFESVKLLYDKLTSSLGSDKAASEFLARTGFVGIKYPAQHTTGGRADGASNYVIFNEADAKIVNRVEFLRTPQGVVYGWTDGKKVYLTKDGMNPETPIHEYTHIWAKAMMQGNPEGWQSVKDLLRGTPIWNEVINDPNYEGIRENEDAVASEALSRLSGKENARRMEQEARKMIDEAKGIMAKAEAVTLIERMRKALQEFWSWVGKSLFDIKEFGSIEEVTDRVLWDLVRNAELGVRNDGEIEKQIIGERGAEALDKAEEATHRMDNLAVAREMEDAGKDAKAIRMATGWERGADGKWRYEIEDLKLIEGWEVKADRVTGVKLSSVIDAKSLFDAYPELADVYVSREKLSGEKGSYDPIMDVITISSDILVGADSVLTHEIQHAIQDIEGFAKGGNLQSVKTRKDELKADARRLYEMMFETPEWGEYVRLTDRWFDHDDTSVEPRIDEINESGVLNAIRQEQERLRKKYGNDANVGKILNQPYAMDADIWNRLPKRFDDRHDAYRRLGGEVEARNVQSRMGMSAEQRRATLLAETEDVAREDQIFLMGNSGVSAMGSRVEKRMAEIASLFEGKELSEEQRAVADVFGGKADNLTISVKTHDGNTHKVVMRQGNENKAGAKHSVFRHYETASNSYTADEILLIPQIIEQGERKQEGKKVSYKMEIDGVTYSVTTEINNRGVETFTNFYTNRSGNTRSSNTQLSAQADSITASTDKVSDKVGDVQEEDVLFRDGGAFYSNAEEAVLNIRQDKATPEQWLAMIQKNGGLKAGEDKWLGLSEWLTEKGKSRDERGKSLVLTK